MEGERAQDFGSIWGEELSLKGGRHKEAGMFYKSMPAIKSAKEKGEIKSRKHAGGGFLRAQSEGWEGWSELIRKSPPLSGETRERKKWGIASRRMAHFGDKTGEGGGGDFHETSRDNGVRVFARLCHSISM